MKKLVEREHLQYVLEQLIEILNICRDGVVNNKLLELMSFFDEKVLESEKDTINELKRTIYKNMINADNNADNEKWYSLYQQLKSR